AAVCSRCGGPGAINPALGDIWVYEDECPARHTGCPPDPKKAPGRWKAPGMESNGINLFVPGADDQPPCSGAGQQTEAWGTIVTTLRGGRPVAAAARRRAGQSGTRVSRCPAVGRY